MGIERGGLTHKLSLYADDILLYVTDPLKSISDLYNTVCNIIPHTLQDVKRLWENDLGEEMTDDQLRTVLDLVNTSSFCTRHSLMQLFFESTLDQGKAGKNFP